MTREQYERWKDFSLRLVGVVLPPRSRKPNKAKVREIIEFFFDCCMDPYDEWSRVRGWDHTEKDVDGRYAMCCWDHMSDIAQYHVPGYWGLPDDYDKSQAIIDKWMGPVRACVRAALDVVVAPSAGVLGFTAGDIRKIYPEGVPTWFTDWIRANCKTKEGKPVDFAYLLDSCRLWL